MMKIAEEIGTKKGQRCSNRRECRSSGQPNSRSLVIDDAVDADT